MKIKRFEELNEGGIINWDASNIRNANRIAFGKKRYTYTMYIKEPYKLETKDDDLINKLKFYLNRDRIDFEVNEEEITD